MNAPQTLREASCADDYDPNSMAVDRARALIRQFLSPVSATERLHIRMALDRILAQEIVSPIAVPGKDNSAMDGWAVRFAEYLAPRTPYVAEGKDVAGFLSALAVNQRASQSTQKQALNALVFFMQESLHRDLGEFKFSRAQRGPKIPTVLSKEECVQLFAAIFPFLPQFRLLE